MSVSVGGNAVRTKFDPPIGSIIFVGHANDPGDNVGDWLECNGQNVSRITNVNLYNKIGVIWGAGDGATTFTLPDFRRRSPVGKGGTGTAALANTVGSTGGEEAHVQLLAELVTHNHGGGGNTGNASDGTIWDHSAGPFNVQIINGSLDNPAAQHTHPYTIPNAGSSSAFNVYHPVAVGGFWIRAT